MKKSYKDFAKEGISAKLPKLEVFDNQFKDYEITIEALEFTSICPKTKLPDFGKITIKYVPDKYCVELKSLKLYLQDFRNLGIFYENAVNKILKDFVFSCKPKWATVTGEFNIRGGLKSTIEAKYVRVKK
jgi:7-cyano-7-deazaguanine reductase